MSDLFSIRLQQTAERISAHLDEILDSGLKSRCPGRLIAAMRYGVLNGGKRLRPFLVIESAALFGVSQDSAMQTACALECVHCYSLIHDDLPAMDDDDLRRGKPTVHKAFDEATAILAGDALLTLAFELLADDQCHADPIVHGQLSLLLAKASGGEGMIGGQVFDIAAESENPDETQIRLLQSMKTGALIRFACQAGALLGGADRKQLESIVGYGEKIGLAFQLADDLLDVTSNSAMMGKATGKDQDAGKGTLVGIVGVEKARNLLAETVDDAVADLVNFGPKADILRETARFIAERNH